MKHVRNVAIILALAAAIAFIPGGGTAAALLVWLLGILFIGGLAWFVFRLYREYRVTLFSLEDRWRGLLYAACGLALLTLTASSQLFATAAGTFAWILLIAASVFAVFAVYRASRTY
jgi:surface polysaccharide O-acyltransferase-like enzyme